jgi:hypothetical protein
MAESPKGRGLRRTLLGVAGLETVLFSGLVLLFISQAGSSDPLSRVIGNGVATLLAIPLVVFALPALVLGVMGRWLRVALALTILAVPVTLVIYAIM